MNKYDEIMAAARQIGKKMAASARFQEMVDQKRTMAEEEVLQHMRPMWFQYFYRNISIRMPNEK